MTFRQYIETRFLYRIRNMINNSNSIHIKNGSHIADNVQISSSKIYGQVYINENSNIQNSEICGKDIQIGTNAKIFSAHLNGKIKMGDFSSLWGPNIHLFAGTANIEIGSFCSIARGVSLQAYNHNFKKTTSYYIGANLFDESWENENVYKGNITIKNDVWIGAECTILSGVTIDNGAVVAANSVVNSYIPPYAIVGGSPAKIIAYRFSEDIINKLLELQWWDWSLEKIKKNKKLFEDELSIEMLNEIEEN